VTPEVSARGQSRTGGLLLAPLSPSAYASFLALSAHSGLIGKVSKGSIWRVHVTFGEWPLFQPS